jgi:hypothetical protein
MQGDNIIKNVRGPHKTHRRAAGLETWEVVLFPTFRRTIRPLSLGLKWRMSVSYCPGNGSISSFLIPGSDWPIPMTWSISYPDINQLFPDIPHFSPDDKAVWSSETSATSHFYMVPAPKSGIDINNESAWNLEISYFLVVRTGVLFWCTLFWDTNNTHLFLFVVSCELEYQVPNKYAFEFVGCINFVIENQLLDELLKSQFYTLQHLIPHDILNIKV